MDMQIRWQCPCSGSTHTHTHIHPSRVYPHDCVIGLLKVALEPEIDLPPPGGSRTLQAHVPHRLKRTTCHVKITFFRSGV